MDDSELERYEYPKYILYIAVFNQTIEGHFKKLCYMCNTNVIALG